MISCLCRWNQHWQCKIYSLRSKPFKKDMLAIRFGTTFKTFVYSKLQRSPALYYSCQYAPSHTNARILPTPPTQTHYTFRMCIGSCFTVSSRTAMIYLYAHLQSDIYYLTHFHGRKQSSMCGSVTRSVTHAATQDTIYSYIHCVPLLCASSLLFQAAQPQQMQMCT